MTSFSEIKSTPLIHSERAALVTEFPETKSTISASSIRYNVFISHRGTDKRTVAFPLMALFGVFCHERFAFFDQTSIGIGEPNKAVLQDAIDASETCLAVIGEDFFTSKWCVWEVDQFLSRSSAQIPVIPLFAGLNPEDCRHLNGKSCVDKSGRPLSEEEIVHRKAIAKKLGDCSGYSQGAEQTIKMFVANVMLDFLSMGLPAKDKTTPRILVLADAFRGDENLLEKIEFVYDKALGYFDVSHQRLNAGLFREFVTETKRTLLGIQAGHIYQPSKVQAHLSHYYTGKAVFMQNSKAKPVDEQTFTHLALIKEKTEAEKKQEAEALRQGKSGREAKEAGEDSNKEKPSKDALYWQMSQLDEILKPKEDIDLIDIFNGKLQQKSTDKTNQNILLLGAPGCGKTMFTLRVMGAFAKLPLETKGDALVETLHQRYDWVFCLPLRSLTADDCKMNYAEILYQKGLLPENTLLTNPDDRAHALNALLNVQARQLNPRVLLLLDGFDELSEDLKEKVMQRFIHNSPFQVILTSRPWGLSENVRNQFGYHMETLGFSEAQVKQYIARYPFPQTVVNPQAMLEALFSKPLRMRALMHIPICLELICQLAQDEESLKDTDTLQTATQLYQRIVHHLLKHNAQRPIGVQEKHLDLEVIHDFFTRLAFHTMVQDEKEIFLDKPSILFERKRAEALLQHCFGLPANEEELKRSSVWRELMHENNPLLRFSNEDCYFMHLTVQEYLSACGMLRNLEHPHTCEATAKFIIKQRTNPQYRRMFLYVAGLAKDSPQLLNRFFALLLQPPHAVGRVYETCLIIGALEECGISENLILKKALLDYIAQTFLYLCKHREHRSGNKKDALEQIADALREAPLLVERMELVPKLLDIAQGGLLTSQRQQMSAIEYLGALGAAETDISKILLVLLEKMRDKDGYLRRVACDTLAALAARVPEAFIPNVFDILLEKTRDENGYLRRVALKALSGIAPRVSETQFEEVFNISLEKTRDEDSDVRRAALDLLGSMAPRIPETQFVEVLKTLLEKERDKDVYESVSAFRALNSMGPHAPEAQFLEIFKAAIEETRDGRNYIALELLGSVALRISEVQLARVEEVLKVLLKKTQDKGWFIRRAAVKLFGSIVPRISEGRFGEVLLKALLEKTRDEDSDNDSDNDSDDHYKFVRRSAVELFGNIVPRISEGQFEEVLKVLFEKTRDEHNYVGGAALELLGSIVPRISEVQFEEVFNISLEKTQDEDWLICESASRLLLDNIVPRTTEGQFEEVLKAFLEKVRDDGKSYLRLVAYEALTALAPRVPEVRLPNVLDILLEKMRDDGKSYLRHVVCKALTALAPRAPTVFIPRIEQALYGKLPAFPVLLSDKTVYYPGSGRVHFFPKNSQARVAKEASSAEVRDQKYASLVLDLDVYIETKKQKQASAKCDVARIQAATQIIREIKQGRDLGEILASPKLRENIGNRRLADILKAYDPLLTQSKCALM